MSNRTLLFLGFVWMLLVGSFDLQADWLTRSDTFLASIILFVGWAIADEVAR